MIQHTMKMIKYTLLTSFVLALLPLVLHAKPFFPTLWGRANFKTSKAPRFVGTDSAPLSPTSLSRRELLSLLRGGDAPPPPSDGPPPPRNGRRNGNDNSKWVGGYIGKNEKLDYPQTKPDLSSVPMTGNHDNIDKLDRMMKVKYPEFSWLVDKGDTSTRRYIKMYHDISRIAYTNEGKVYSIICPQLGLDLDRFCLPGTGNIEIHVGAVRGWVNEDTHTVCADVTLEAIVWIDMKESEKRKHPHLARFVEKLDTLGLPFSKENGMVISAYCPGKPYEPNCPLLNGTDSSPPVPIYAEHDESFSVAHIATKIVNTKTGIERTDDVYEILSLFMEIILPGMLSPGSIIDWNLWFESPEPVNQTEWRDHTEGMRLGIRDHNRGTDLGREIGMLRNYDGNYDEESTTLHMIFRRIPAILRKLNMVLKKHHLEAKVTGMVLQFLVTAFRHFFFSDKTNQKGNYLFMPFVYPIIDVVAEVGMLLLAFVCMEEPAKMWIGTLVAFHGLLLVFTNYGYKGKVFKNIPVFPVTYMINYDKVLLILSVLSPFIFGEHFKFVSVKYISVIVGMISWFIILPRLVRDPSPNQLR